jgi:hypothetical protein
MQVRKALHHIFNVSAAFTGAVGAAICVPLLALSLVGFPNGPSSSRPDENLKYGAGAAASIALFTVGYRRRILKEKPQQP